MRVCCLVLLLFGCCRVAEADTVPFPRLTIAEAEQQGWEWTWIDASLQGREDLEVESVLLVMSNPDWHYGDHTITAYVQLVGIPQGVWGELRPPETAPASVPVHMPEPASLFLLGAGLCATMVRGLRKAH